VIVAATVHFPYMTAWPERASANDRAATQAGFKRLGNAFRDAGVETIVVFTSEHIVNLQPRMAPPFTVGVGHSHHAFAEPQFKLEPITRRGNPALAQKLVQELYAAGFDAAHSSELRLDHGTTLPLAQLGIGAGVAVVPIIINSIFAPLPPLQRCRMLGSAVASILARSDPGRRVGILATGGLSHTVGAIGMERNDPEFDADFMSALVDGNLETACDFADRRLDAAGNGTHEIRNWVAAAGAAFPRRPKVVTKIAFAPGWNSGVHQLLWESA
jgi:aromatic ring-opening dioxygenase catalytic subunit (LigB family)